MRHHLSDVQVQLARKLGMNPVRLGKLDNYEQEPWKMPLGTYIEHLYRKRFGKAVVFLASDDSSFLTET